MKGAAESPDSQGRVPTSTRSRVLTIVAFAVICLFKLWLIGDEEILAENWDASDYASISLDYFSGSDNCSIGRRPGAPLFIAAARTLGIPYRIAIELAFLVAATFFSWSIAKATGSRILGTLCLLLIGLHPETLVIFRRLLSEPVVMVFVLLTVGCLLRLLTRRSIRWFHWELWALALSVVAWDLPRKETFLVLATYAAWLLLAVAVRWSSDLRTTSREAALLLLPLGFLFVSHTMVKQTNLRQCGVAGMSRMEEPGIQRLMETLYRIEPQERIHRAPVTRQSLLAAIGVSPTLASMSEDLTSEVHTRNGDGSLAAGRPGEFGSRLNHVLLASFDSQPGVRNRQMLEASREIEAAFGSGRLPERQVFFPLDPAYSLWVPRIPAAIMGHWWRMNRTEPWTPAFDTLPGSPPLTRRIGADRQLFDLAASRRSTLTGRNYIYLSGYYCAGFSGIDRVELEYSDGVVGPTTLETRELSGEECGSTSLSAGTSDPQSTRLVFRAGEVRLASLPIEQLEVGLQQEATGERSVVWLTGSLWIRDHAQDGRVRNAFKSALSRLYGPGCWIGSLLFYYVAWRRPEAFDRRSTAVAAGILLVLLAGRLAMLGVLSASLGWEDPRFITTVSPLFPAACLLVAVVTAATSSRLRFTSTS